MRNSDLVAVLPVPLVQELNIIAHREEGLSQHLQLFSVYLRGDGTIAISEIKIKSLGIFIIYKAAGMVDKWLAKKVLLLLHNAQNKYECPYMLQRILPRPSLPTLWLVRTDKKENQIFLIY
jgi:hypothetical protein